MICSPRNRFLTRNVSEASITNTELREQKRLGGNVLSATLSRVYIDFKRDGDQVCRDEFAGDL